MAAVPGWYGKLPVLGDFAQRRLPADFLSVWDAWLQEGLSQSRVALGSDWLDSYLTAHVWHFLLLPGVLGPACWTGVWMPSVDRVGRYFPLTLALALPEVPRLTAALAELGTWLQHLEACARLGLRLVDGIDPLERALEALAPPPCGEQWPQRFRRLREQLALGELSLELPADSGNPFPAACLEALAGCCLEAALSAHSLWWCHGDNGQSGGFVVHNLPAPSFMTKMLVYSPAGSRAASI